MLSFHLIKQALMPILNQILDVSHPESVCLLLGDHLIDKQEVLNVL